MPELLNKVDGVACRACGAVRAPPMVSDNSGLEWRICENCWRSFCRHLGIEPSPDSPTIEDDFNRWLARKLFLDLRRMEQTGVAGRCEAVSDWLYGVGYKRGQQCAMRATGRRDGRLVCSGHLSATSPAFVDDDGALNRPYEMLGDIIGRLVKRDAKLLATISAAIGEQSVVNALTVNLG